MVLKAKVTIPNEGWEYRCRDLAKHLGECRVAGIINVRIGQDTAYQYKSCQCTYHDRIPEVPVEETSA